jgi:hypothetical protein
VYILDAYAVRCGGSRGGCGSSDVCVRGVVLNHTYHFCQKVFFEVGTCI